MDQTTAEADPYNWVFFTNTTAGASGGFGLEPFGLTPFGTGTGAISEYYARRKQEHGMVYQYGTSLNQLLTAITSYEADVASRGGVVSHEWGPVVGPPRTVDGSHVHVQLISPGN